MIRLLKLWTNPSNFIRIQELYQNDLEQFKRFFILYLSDEETLEAMKTIYKRDGYIAEPHGAVGYLGLKGIRKSPKRNWNFLGNRSPN
jgi:threonine synthase